MPGRTEKPLPPNGTAINDLARRLRQLRSDVGLTYDQLAKESHYSKTALQAVCAGRPPLSPAVATAFITACGQDVATWQPFIAAAVAGALNLDHQTLPRPGPRTIRRQAPSTTVTKHPPPGTRRVLTQLLLRVNWADRWSLRRSNLKTRRAGVIELCRLPRPQRVDQMLNWIVAARCLVTCVLLSLHPTHQAPALSSRGTVLQPRLCQDLALKLISRNRNRQHPRS